LSDRLNEAPALEGEGGEQRNRGLRKERRPEQTGGQGRMGNKAFTLLLACWREKCTGYYGYMVSDRSLGVSLRAVTGITNGSPFLTKGPMFSVLLCSLLSFLLGVSRSR
jgi:hypothetical protein